MNRVDHFAVARQTRPAALRAHAAALARGVRSPVVLVRILDDHPADFTEALTIAEAEEGGTVPVMLAVVSHAEVLELFEARHPELAVALAAGDRPRLACVVIADASAASVVWWPVA